MHLLTPRFTTHSLFSRDRVLSGLRQAIGSDDELQCNLCQTWQENTNIPKHPQMITNVKCKNLMLRKVLIWNVTIVGFPRLLSSHHEHTHTHRSA